MSVNLQNGLTTVATLAAAGAQMKPHYGNFRELHSLKGELGEVNGKINRAIDKVNGTGRTGEVEIDLKRSASSSNVFSEQISEASRHSRFNDSEFARSATQGSAETYVKLEDSGVRMLEGEVAHLRNTRSAIQAKISETENRTFAVSPIAAGLSVGACAMHWKMAYDAGNNGETMAAVTHGTAAAGHAMVAVAAMNGVKGLEFGKAGMVLALTATFAAMVFDGQKN